MLHHPICSYASHEEFLPFVEFVVAIENALKSSLLPLTALNLNFHFLVNQFDSFDY